MVSEKYRDLPNFDDIFTHMTYAPGYTSETLAESTGSDLFDQQIDAFEKSYRVWVLQFAEIISNSDDAGFAILTILNSYPEMVAQLHGTKGDKLALFSAGLADIFPEIIGDYQEEITEHLYSYLRSSLAHMGLTSANVILSGDIPCPLAIGISHGRFAISINPIEWLKRIKSHFDAYIEELKNADNGEQRSAFLARLSHPF